MDEIKKVCQIIGVLDNGAAGLSDPALGAIEQADLVVGAQRTLTLFKAHFSDTADCRDLSGNFMQVPDWIREALAANKNVVVLATGDPLCHGIASFLQSRLCIEACEVLPNLSMVQLACARLGMPWQGIKICSVHGKDTGEWSRDKGTQQDLYPLLHQIQQHEQLAIYTSPKNTPDRIARMLKATGLADDFQIAVAERLMLEDERVVTQYSVEDVAESTFAEPNIVVLWRNQLRQHTPRLGLPDKAYHQRKPEKGLITKCEIRAVSLARMALCLDSIVWDIGAGSGSVGIEAARLCPEGRVFAIEKNTADVENARKNQQKFKVHNYQILHDKAPEGLDQWPSPDAIFIGGSGGNLGKLIEVCLSRLKGGGALVMNFVTFENVSVAIETLKKCHAEWDVTQLQTSRSQPILHMHRLAAQNPVWIISASPSEPNK